MKKVLVLFLMVCSMMVYAQENYEVLDEGEIEGFFSYVSIATEDPEVALNFVAEWGITDLDSWVEITAQEIDQLAQIDSKELFESELGGRIGIYLYLYTEKDIKVSAIYEDGILYVTSDNNEVLEELKKNKDLLIKGLFDI